MSDMLKKAVTEALISIIPSNSEQNIVESGALSAVIVDGDQVGIILG